MKHLHGHGFCTTSAPMLVAWPSHEFRILDAFNTRHCRQDPAGIFDRSHAQPDIRSYPVLRHTVNMVTTPY